MMNLREIDTIRIEKQKAMLRYHKFKKLATIARTLELFFAMALFSWSISRSSAYFPAIAELAASFTRWLCKIAVSEHFIFLIGNLIVLALFVKSGRNAESHSKTDNDEESLTREFLVSGEKNNAPIAKLDEDCGVRRRDPEARRTRSDEFELEAKSHSKSAFGDDEESESLIREYRPPWEVSGEENSTPEAKLDEDRGIRRRDPEARRTRSDEFERKVRERGQLRRSETEPPRRRVECSEEVEDLSNEEFQRKVEAFIERQQRFLREESLLMVIRDR